MITPHRRRHGIHISVSDGIPYRNSIVDTEKLGVAKSLVEREGFSNAVLLPIDHVVGKAFDPETESQIVNEAQIPDGWQGLDIGPETLSTFSKQIETANTVVWNGPLGVYEFEKFAQGTIAIAKQIADSESVSILVAVIVSQRYNEPVSLIG